MKHWLAAVVAFGSCFSATAEMLSPAGAFLIAADRNDEQGMQTLLGKSKIPAQIKGCYLRRAYNGPGGEVIGAWMCAEGEKASRVVLASVRNDGEHVKLEIVRETSNNIPAPPRTESALAPEAPQ